MSGVDKKIVVIDTSILLHYKLPGDIDWRKEMHAKEVEIVLTRRVLSELNAHKDRRASRWESRRAAVVLRHIDASLKGNNAAEIRPGVVLSIEPSNPQIDFAQYGLSKDIPDDWVIASAITLCEKCGESAFVLLTNDLGQQAACRSLSVPVVRWDENEHRLADEPDPLEKRNKELEREIQLLKSSAPILSVQFPDGAQHREFTLSGMSAEQIEAAVQREWEEHRPGRKLLRPFFDLDGYDWAVREYCSEYETHLKEVSHFHQHVLTLDLVLVNSGTCVAEGIDIELTIPRHLDVRGEYGLSPPPTPPDPEDYSRSEDDYFDDGSGGLTVIKVRSAPAARTPNGLKPTLDASQGVVCYHVEKAKHNKPVNLGPVYIVFEDPRKPESFAIAYKLLVENMHHPVEGSLGLGVRSPNEAGPP